MQGINDLPISVADISEDAEESLRLIFYKKLQKECKITRVKSFKDSVTIKLISGSMNTAKQNLLSAAVSGSDINLSILRELKENNFIRLGPIENQYIMTLFGVWKIESADYECVNLLNLIKYYDDKWVFKLENMTNEEKVIIFSLICFGSFSRETPLTRKNIDIQESSAEAMEKCEEFLVDLGTIEPLKESKGASSSTEERWSQLFRRMTKLPDKTRMIYSGNSNTYYLNLYNHEREGFNSEGLCFLLWRIFGDKLTQDEEKKISDFSQDMMIRYSDLLYNDETLERIHAYDSIFATSIPNALFEIPNLVHKWK